MENGKWKMENGEWRMEVAFCLSFLKKSKMGGHLLGFRGM